MIFNERQEPLILDRDDHGISDFRPEADWKADARRGSEKLRKALVRAQTGKAPKSARVYRCYGSWQERKLARDQIDKLQNAVARHFGIEPSLLSGSRGPQELSTKRHVAMYLAREIVKSSYPDIAKCFGRQNHTTIMHACRTVEATPELARQAKEIREKIGA